MRILGLFACVFICFFINKALGFSSDAVVIGTIIGAGTYIMGSGKL